MNLRFVEAYHWVVTLKSVTRAAEKLFLTQSAMSSRIAALEEELGVLLLDRRDRQFRLTDQGARFAVHARTLLELQHEIKTEMSGGKGRSTLIRLGAMETVLHPWLIPALERLRSDCQGIDFQLSVENTEALVEQLQRGALDLIFAARSTAGEDLQTQALPVVDMVFVGNADLHRKPCYRPQDLVEFDLLTFQRGSHPHAALLELFRRTGVEARRIHTLSSTSAMIELVERGFGIATLPRSAVRHLNASSRLTTLESEPRLQPLPVYASYRCGPASPAAEIFVRAIVSFIHPTEKLVDTIDA